MTCCCLSSGMDFTDSLIGQLDNEKLDGIAIVGGDLTDEFRPSAEVPFRSTTM